jgi:carbon starvation protein
MKETAILGIAAVLGTVAIGILALSQGETINAAWMVIAAVCIYTIGYRFYSKFIAVKVMGLDDRRLTPAVRLTDGLDYVPTNKVVLFGHHFAAIAGAGPLVGPVLAAQMGYLPGTLWLLIGVVLAGAVQDFMVLFISMRRNGRSLGEMARMELGNFAGSIVMVGALVVMFIILAALAFIVVGAASRSAWTVFSIAVTIPIAIVMGIWMRFVRPGKILEVSIIGFVLMMAGIIFGGDVANTEWGRKLFYMEPMTLTWWLIGYGFVASVLPVWLLLAPRDYLSTFLKLGVIIGLAIGILIALPDLKMPAVTRFIDGTGPVFSGNLFPFLFITIACGACSGFHALVSSGTTPKLVEKESHCRPIGYGAMLGESMVGIMAMICACVLDPGVYFGINVGPGVIGTTAESAAAALSGMGFVVTPEQFNHLAQAVGEHTVLSRTGGAPTFAMGMAVIIVDVFGTEHMMAFWYHFALLFEALFILTAVDAGTRACRFMVQDLFGTMIPALGKTRSIAGNVLATAIAVAGWGYFVVSSVLDPNGGIKSLWPLFGIGNQMLSSMALLLCTVILVKMKKEKYVWVPIVPTVWLFITSMTAGWQKIFHADPKIGFIAAGKVAAAADKGQIAFNNYVNASVTAFVMVVAFVMLAASIMVARKALRNPKPTVNESEAVYSDDGKVPGNA